MVARLIGFFLLVAGALLLLTCNDYDFPKSEYPRIETRAVIGATDEGVIFQGAVIQLGREPIVRHGFRWSLNPEFDASTEQVQRGAISDEGVFQIKSQSAFIEDRVYYVRAFAATGNFIVFGQVVSFTSKGSLPPVIEAITPAEGTWGDEVTVKGKYFSGILSFNKVDFGARSAKIQRVTDSTITCIVPEEITTPTVQVVVTTLGNASPPASFKLTTPAITAVVPNAGTWGDTVVIRGKHLAPRARDLSVDFNNWSAKILAATDSTVRVIVPSGSFEANATVRLRANRQTAFAAQPFVYLAPVLRSITPPEGDEGDTLLIRGSNFRPRTLNFSIAFSNREARILARTDSTIRCIVPSNIPGNTAQVTARLNGVTAVSPQLFRFRLPVIKSFAPVSGTFDDVVTIVGQGFGSTFGANTVKFNEWQAQILTATPTEIRVMVPRTISDSPNQITVIVNSREGKALSNFAILPPTVNGISRNQGKAGDQIEITGDNFNPKAEGNEVFFGQHLAEVVAASRTRLTITVPGGPQESRSIGVTIEVASQRRNVGTFTLLVPWIRLQDNFNVPVLNEFAHFVGANSFMVGPGVTQNRSWSGQVWQFDQLTQNWQPVANFPGVGRNFPIFFSIGDDAYYGGGFELDRPDQLLTDFWKYDATMGDWIQLNDIPVGMNSHSISLGMGLATTTRGFIPYKKAGQNGIRLWEYNPVTDAWVERVGPTGNFDATGFTLGAKLYFPEWPPNGDLFSDWVVFDSNSSAISTARSSGANLTVPRFILDGYGYFDDYQGGLIKNKPGTATSQALNVPFFSSGFFYFTIKNKVYAWNSEQLWEYDPTYD